ncbi:hypothetical protein RJZ56_001585 [Blastomyces dermatitidis]|uniref:Uncharacterized protein n=1 Tax=Ajellomyces dermatitidis (strain ATCC 18188 / CBS 674.68) TaxID=653446 RepID=A0A0J9HF17_AJEDA|nr:hypothetical protein BDDG_12222 [Blastomyces dermatitidis ATCC 18188]
MTLEEINHLFAQSGVSAQHVVQHIQKERRGARLVGENGHEIRLVPPKETSEDAEGKFKHSAAQRGIAKEAFLCYKLINRHSFYLLERPIRPHFVRAKLIHLVIHMEPQDLPKPIRNRLQIFQFELLLGTLARRKIPLHLRQTRVDTLVLHKQLEFVIFNFKRWHTLAQVRKHQLLLNPMVDLQVIAEVCSNFDELLHRHVLWKLVGNAGVV